MSYILDALRKAERDRNLGRTPSLGDVTAPVARPPSRRPSNRTLGLIALVAVLLICTIALWPRRPATQPSVPPPATVAAAQPVPVAPPPVVAAPLAPEPASPPEAPAAAADGMIAEDVPADSIDDLMAEPEAPAEEADATDAQASAPATPPAAVSPESIPTVSDPAPGPKSEPPAIDEAATTPGVPLLRDMPADYRGAFPELRVDVHVYDEDPARRWVLINGHKAVEGATLAEGPTVSRITPEGIVFDFRGRSTLFPLNR
jgi:general secretion pathway protein B